MLPDGSGLVLAAVEDENSSSQLWLQPFAPRVSPDGRSIVYGDADGLVFRMPTTGGKPSKIVDTSVNDFALSPDNRFIA